MAEVTRLSFDQGGQFERQRLHLREISPDIVAPLETVGQDLRAARQRKGEDVASVSRGLKIQKSYLNALEESQFYLLPGRAYAIGFVRSYAQYLELEAPKLVERYKAEIAGFDEAEEKEICLAPEIENKFPQGAILFASLLLIGIAYGEYYLQTSANQMLTERETEIPDRLEAVVAEQPQALAVPQPAPAERATAAGGPGAESTSGALADAVLRTADIQGTTQNVAAELPVGQTYGTRNAGSRITLRMQQPARVRVVGADNTLFINRNLSPGDIYQTPDISGMTISTANSGAVELLLDGESVGFLGANGAAVDALSLNPQDIVDRARLLAD